MSNVPETQPSEVFKLEKEGFKLIDVRSSEEFNGELGHVPGSELVVLGDELDQWLKKQNPNTKIVFICRSGNRSGKATLQAQEQGLTSCYNMTGGMLLWNELKLETEK